MEFITHLLEDYDHGKREVLYADENAWITELINRNKYKYFGALKV